MLYGSDGNGPEQMKRSPDYEIVRSHEIRPAGVEATDQIAGLASAEVADAWSPVGFAEQLGRTGNRSWIAASRGADAQDAIPGYIVCEQILDELHILSLAVRSGLRRQGIGRALVRQALVVASAAGANVVHLEVRASNRPAVRLYEGLDFEIVGIRPRYYAGGEDAVLMSLVLMEG